ncbi:MAG: PHB depolymerase family esterase [Polyangiaceae bacterium]
MRAVFLFALPVLVACESHRPVPDGAPPGPAATAPTSAVARPYALHVPPGLDASRPAPLVVSLHGYGASSGEAHAKGLGLDRLADEQGLLLAMPDGTKDSAGNRFWNASDACCDFEHSGVDDVAYIAWLLDDVERKHEVDRNRVFVVGHSNGGFLAHRLACDLSARLAGAISIAGAGPKDPSRCKPIAPVSILEIHGDADTIIAPGGGRVFGRPLPEYPSTQATIAMWLEKDACGPGAQPAPAPLDFDDSVPGAETQPVSYRGCRDGVTVDLWTVAGGSHLPRPSRAGLVALGAWMTAHAAHGR